MKNNNAFWISLGGAIVVAFIIAIWVPGEPNKKVVYAIEYGGLIITFLFGFMILVAIASGKIDISPKAAVTNGLIMACTTHGLISPDVKCDHSTHRSGDGVRVSQRRNMTILHAAPPCLSEAVQ